MVLYRICEQVLQNLSQTLRVSRHQYVLRRLDVNFNLIADEERRCLANKHAHVEALWRYTEHPPIQPAHGEQIGDKRVHASERLLYHF